MEALDRLVMTPELQILKDGHVVGAVQNLDMHSTIYANRAVSYGIQFADGDSYQIKSVLPSLRFYKAACAKCGTEHKVLGPQPMNEGSSIIDVRIIRASSPYHLEDGIFIYQDVKFI